MRAQYERMLIDNSSSAIKLAMTQIIATNSKTVQHANLRAIGSVGRSSYRPIFRVIQTVSPTSRFGSPLASFMKSCNPFFQVKHL